MQNSMPFICSYARGSLRQECACLGSQEYWTLNRHPGNRMVSPGFHLIDMELSSHTREDEILHPLTMLAQRAVRQEDGRS